MNQETILCSVQDTVATVTLNRANVHNAMNETMIAELTSCFKEFGTDPSIRCIILTSTGKSFCAGADLNWMKKIATYSPAENIHDSKRLLDLYQTIYMCPKPVIGKITGNAFGGGLGLIAVCDLTIGIPNLLFAFSEIKLGIVPAVISTFVAPRIQAATLRRLFITGERFDSNHAHEIGLLDIVTTSDELEKKVVFYLEQLHTSSPKAVYEVKQLIKKMRELSQEDYEKFTVEKIAELRASPEGQEGITAFLEKRKTTWSE